MTKKELIPWAGGLFSGEGTFVVSRAAGAERGYISARVAMQNEQAVKLFAKAVSVGHVTGPHGPYPGCKAARWVWCASSIGDVQKLWALLKGYLSDEKVAQGRAASSKDHRRPLR